MDTDLMGNNHPANRSPNATPRGGRKAIGTGGRNRIGMGGRNAVGTGGRNQIGMGGRIKSESAVELRKVPDYIDRPGAKQICWITRQRTIKGKTSTEVVHAITSLTRRRAGATRLLELSRGHWSIENNLHGHRDVTFAEDAARTRRRNGPQALAALRNSCLTVITRAGVRRVEALERFAENRSLALKAVSSRLMKMRRRASP